jgi:hypothetical protein
MSLMLAVLTLSLSISPLLAEPSLVEEAESAFREGNTVFQKGEFEAAIRIYEELAARGYASGPLYYNLGNAYYREGDIARAILNYERARHWMPNDEDLAHNLEVARLMTVDQIEPIPRLFLWDYWDSFRDSLPVSTLILIGYTAYLLILGCVALFSFSRQLGIRRYGILTGTGAGIVLVLVILLLGTRVSRMSSREYGIIMPSVVEVKNAPDDEGPNLFVLHGGSKMKITDRVGEWIQIRLEDGKVGWMNESGAEII